jgi:hypothetical protein
MPLDTRKIRRPRRARATVPVSRREFEELVVQVQQTIAAVERLQHDYLIQVRRSGELQVMVNRLVQHVQAITATLAKPDGIE